MVETHYYLTGLNVEQNNGGSAFRVSGTDYSGRKFYGEFNKESFKSSMLEVRVIGLVCDSDWAWIKPVGGVFQDRADGIRIRKADIQKIIGSQFIFPSM